MILKTKSIVFFDEEEAWLDMLPLTFTRPRVRLRVGITVIFEKWQQFCDSIAYISKDYIISAQHLPRPDDGESLYISGGLLPNSSILEILAEIPLNTRLVCEGRLLAFKGTKSQWENRDKTPIQEITEDSVDEIRRPFDIFLKNSSWITNDFERLSSHKDGSGETICCNLIGNPKRLFIAKGASAVGATFNTTGGPIWIGENAQIMEGACLRGPVSIGENSVVKMGAVIYPGTTVGPWCKVGGELNNVVIHGYTNKAHDGFLGNAVIGKWCNIGAGCTASNLKNDYSEIKLWNYRKKHFEKTGLQFCGLIMGDHTKAGVNTMFNTATVVGVGCNIHGSGFPRNFIPSFSDGGSAGFVDVSLPKFFETAGRVMARRGKELTEVDEELFKHIFRFADSFK